MNTYTPGQDKPGPAVIVNYNETIQMEYNGLKSRRRELTTQVRQCSAEINQVQANLGAMAAEGCDYSEYTANLGQLRLQVEALELGIHYLDGQMGLLKRSNVWLIE